MLSLVALPLVVSATREGLQAIPDHVREASYAVGKTKAATTRRILLPAARPSVATGAMLGLGRIIGDTAIIVVLLGATAELRADRLGLPVQLPPGRRKHPDQLRLLQLPHGGVATNPQKAYAAAFVLMLLVLVLNAAVDVVHRRCPKGRLMEFLKPPPVRRLDLEHAPRREEAPERRARTSRNGNGNGNGSEHRPASPPPGKRRIGAPQLSIPRMEIDKLSVAYDGKLAVKEVSSASPPGRGPRPDRSLGLRQDNAAALAQRLTELTRSASLSGRITLDGVDISADGADRAAAAGDDGLPAAEPVPDERVRQPRLRPARAGLAAGQSPLAATTRSARRSTVPGCSRRSRTISRIPALRLSGGQQQRLCIARALVAKPEVLLLDEPCSALDPQSTEKIEELIVKLREDVAVVIVTHNLQQAYRVADYVGFMYLGDLVEYGGAKKLFGKPEPGPDEGVHQRWLRLARTGRSAPSRSLFLVPVVAGLHDDPGRQQACLASGRAHAGQPEGAGTEGTDPDMHVVRTSVVHGKDRVGDRRRASEPR